MEIHKEELKIIDLFRKNLLSEFTIQEIMKRLNKNSYNWTYKAIMKLGKEILNVKKAGNTTVIRLNLSQKSITYLSFLDKKEAYSKEIPLIEEIIESISQKTPYFTLLVTGSYATGTARKDSDIDLIVIVESDLNRNEIIPYIKEITMLSEITVDLHVFTKQEFYTMLTNDDENLGKEVFRKHLLFYGIDAYYQIIRETIKNGLSIKIRLSKQ